MAKFSTRLCDSNLFQTTGGNKWELKHTVFDINLSNVVKITITWVSTGSELGLQKMVINACATGESRIYLKVRERKVTDILFYPNFYHPDIYFLTNIHSTNLHLANATFIVPREIINPHIYNVSSKN